MKRIEGKEIFFNIIEVDFNDNQQKVAFIEQMHNKEIDGFLCKGVLNLDEVKSMINLSELINPDDYLKASNGKLFPYPYGAISDKTTALDTYIDRNEKFSKLPISLLKNRFDEFFKNYSGKFSPKIPKLLKTDKEGAFANFRYFLPNMGGLFVHCGYFFENLNPTAFEVMQPMNKEGQLSFFMVMQKPEIGGELTIYDMLWPEIQKKDNFEENEYVLDTHNNKKYLKDVKSFIVNPEPGDIFVFRGGPIWHRVENISGNLPRITFGGFINFSNNTDEFYYWC